jgi:hypothetical protein
MATDPPETTPSFDPKESEYYNTDGNRIMEDVFGLTDGQAYLIHDIRVEDGIQKIVVEWLGVP